MSLSNLTAECDDLLARPTGRPPPTKYETGIIFLPEYEDEYGKDIAVGFYDRLNYNH
jgi:hypothetical protein